MSSPATEQNKGAQTSPAPVNKKELSTEPVIEAKCSSVTSAPHPASITGEAAPAPKEAEQPVLAAAKSAASTGESSVPMVAIHNIDKYNDIIQETDSILLHLQKQNPEIATQLASKFNAITTSAAKLSRENSDLNMLDKRAHSAFMDHLRSALSATIEDPELRKQLEAQCSKYKDHHVELRQFRNDFHQVVEKASYGSRSSQSKKEIALKEVPMTRKQVEASQVKQLLNASPTNTEPKRKQSPTERMASSSKTSSLIPSAKKRRPNEPTEAPGLLRRILM